MTTNDLYCRIALLKNLDLVMYEAGICEHIYECPKEKVYYLTVHKVSKEELKIRGWEIPGG